MQATAPETTILEEVRDWRPPQGAISIYIETDPADRALNWRVALRDRLKQIVADAKRVDTKLGGAVRATADRIEARFRADTHPGGRCQVGLVEVAESEGGREWWTRSQLVPTHTGVWYGERPHLEPLVELLDEGSPVGIVVLTGEEVRLFEWRLGSLEEIDDFEAVFTSLDWRERKAQAPSDPARGRGTSTSGRDQHEQRIEANRERFLHDTGRRLDGEAEHRSWPCVLAFGDRDYVNELAAGSGSERIRFTGDSILIHEDWAELERRALAAVDDLNRDRERRLVEQAKSAALSRNGHGSLGIAATMSALTEARAEHVVFQADGGAAAPRHDGLADVADELIERAIATGAKLTPVEGDAAAELADHEGVAALLRY